jgi:formate-dependent nitrite reductase membrane component NrfD
MSIGSWCLLIFGIFAFLSMVMTIITKGKSGGALNHLKRAISWIGIVTSAYLILYTGVLLGSTSQTLWTSTYLIGALFFASGLSTGIAAISLIAGRREELKDSIKKLERADKKAIIVEMVILLLLIIALYLYGAETRLALNKLIRGQNGLFFWGGVVVLGLALPLLSFFRRERAFALTNIMMLFILLGGFVMRYVLLIAGQI